MGDRGIAAAGACAAAPGDGPLSHDYNGTSSRPVLGLDLAHMAEICQEESLDLLHQVRLSLAHELAHAYQETLGMDAEHAEGFDEDDAEAFARVWVDSGEIQISRLHRPVHDGLRPQMETFN